MTVRATKFTPEVLLTAPRRSAGAPNEDASKVLFTIKNYSFADHKWNGQIRVLDVESQESKTIVDNSKASEPKWIGDSIVYLAPGEEGATKVEIADPNLDAEDR